MNVGPVYWGSYPGEMLEKIMAVLIAQEHPGAMRRTPSSGDGGVDILIRDGDGWHVRQVKGYTGRLGGRRRNEVEKSFKTLCTDPRLEAHITRWDLTVPIDPTSGEQEWFESVTRDADFPSGWDGEVFWHAIAARNPHVIDYYLRDGRGRVESRARMLLEISNSPTEPLSANDVAGHLELLRASLNREDPHYRYEFVTGPAALQGHVPEGCVVSVTREVEDSALMIQVFPKHQYALEDAPIGGTMDITIFSPDQGIDIREQFDSFRTYGTAIDLPEGSLSGNFVAPGGLGGQIQGGSGRIGPNLVSDPPPRTRIRLVHPDDGPIVEVALITETATRGELDRIEIQARDGSGVLVATFRVHPPGSRPPLTFNVSTSNLANHAVQEIIPAVRFLASFKPPMRFEWLPQFGNQVLAGQTIDEDVALVTEEELLLFEDLSVIQDHVRETVMVPEEIPAEAVHVIRRTAHLIRMRETTGTWKDIDVNLKEGVVREEVLAGLGTEASIAMQRNEVLELAGRQYELGPVHYVFATARIADPQPDDPGALRFVAGTDNSMIQRLGPLPDEDTGAD